MKSYPDWEHNFETYIVNFGSSHNPKCCCDWGGSECCPVHFKPRDWEEEQANDWENG